MSRGSAPSRQNELLILPPLKAVRGPNGGLILTRKYIEGVGEFARNWSGPVTSLVAFSQTPTTDMDHSEFFPGDPATPIEPRPESETTLAARIKDAAVVLAFLSPSEAPLFALCKRLGVPVVFFAEYSPATERQIIDAETTNPLLRLRRKLWIQRATHIRRGMAAEAAGLQLSGTPVFEAYRDCNPNSLLFFDNRVRTAEVMTATQMDAKAATLAQGAPLRLAFGGRLIAMKGVADLPKLAAELGRQHVPYTLDIYGSGPLEGALRQQIAAAGLDGTVRLRGALDFRTGWLPALKHETDLFICPHPQGDPSSTYPEVMSCGTAIAGYDNEAFSGIAAVSGSGWVLPMRDHRALARQIGGLHRDRSALITAARQARLFALENSFEKVFARRATQLAAASRIGPGH